MTKQTLLTLLVAIILASFVLASLMQLGNAQQSTLPTPSVPEFSLKPSGYNNRIEVTIKNQPFSPQQITWIYRDENKSGGSTSLWYDVQVKEHHLQDWTEVYDDNYPIQSNSNSSNYTVLHVPNYYQEGSQIDIRVRAIIGGYFPPRPASWVNEPLIFVSKNSSWSNPQTITTPKEFPSPSASVTPLPSPVATSTPTVVIVQAVPMWFYFAIIGLVIVIAILLAAIALLLRRSKRP